MKNLYAEEDKKKFLDYFMAARSDGQTRKDAYQTARRMMGDEGKTSPSYETLMRWIKFGAYSEEAEEDAPETSEAEETDAVPETSASEETDAVTETVEVMKMLLRLYRRRSEKDVDSITDHLIPGLLEEG